MSGIEHALHGALSWLRPAWDVITRLAVTLWHRAVSLWCEVCDRHERLMDTDPRYPVALAAGGGAVIKVMVSNPAVARAVTVLLADLLGSHDREITRPTYRPTSPWPSGQGSSLWDRDDWDQE